MSREAYVAWESGEDPTMFCSSVLVYEAILWEILDHEKPGFFGYVFEEGLEPEEHPGFSPAEEVIQAIDAAIEIIKQEDYEAFEFDIDSSLGDFAALKDALKVAQEANIKVYISIL